MYNFFVCFIYLENIYAKVAYKVKLDKNHKIALKLFKINKLFKKQK